MTELTQGGATATPEAPADSHEGLMPTPGAAAPATPELNPTAMADVDSALEAGGTDSLGAPPPPAVEPPPATPVEGTNSPVNPLMPVGTPGREALDATHQQMVAEKTAAAAATPSQPLHKRIFGALGFGGGKTETPAQPAATPDHLTPTGNGTLETQPMANVTPEAASAVSSSPTPAPELNAPVMTGISTEAAGAEMLSGAPAPALENPSTAEAGTTAEPGAPSLESPASPTTVESAPDAADAVVSPPSLGSENTQAMGGIAANGMNGESAQPATGMVSPMGSEAPSSSTGMEPPAPMDAAPSIGGSNTAGTEGQSATSPLSSPDPAGGLDLERAARPAEASTAQTAEVHADPLQVGPTLPEAPGEGGAPGPTIPGGEAPSGLTDAAPAAATEMSAPSLGTPTLEPPAASGMESPSMSTGIPVGGETAPISAAPMEPTPAEAPPAALGGSVDGSTPAMGAPVDATTGDPNATGGTGTPPTATS